MDREFTDFFIAVRGRQEVKCHRSVLSAASPLFQSMMSHEMQEASQRFANVDEPADAIIALLE